MKFMCFLLDTDECSDPRLNDCAQLCENTFGSYSCRCKTGYIKENETSCVGRYDLFAVR